MKILVDARLLHGGGIGRFLRQVSARWLREAVVSEIRFLGRSDELDAWLADVDERGIGRSVEFSHPPYALRAQTDWLRRADGLRGNADVAFFPHYDVPLLRHPRPSVLVVHDLTQFLLPEAFPRIKRVAGRILLNRALDQSDHVITVSECSRRDLLRWDPELEARLDVVYPGVDPVFRPLGEGARSRAEGRWEAILPFLLMVGSDRPHKNLVLGPKILGRLEEEWPTLKLVVVGTRRDPSGPVAAAAAAEGVLDRTIELGDVDDASLRELYGLARALLFPSLYEGFGLPPLESMACGTPVIASDRGALPEVLDGHAVLLDPDDPGPWARQVTRILTSDRWIPRASSDSAGREHADSFSWDRTAAEIFEIVRRVARRTSLPGDFKGR